jgi:hypothetical protein
MKMKGRCEYCLKLKTLTREHVLPRSMGGTQIIGVCKSCNKERKNDLSYSGFLEWVVTHRKQFNQAVNTSKNRQEIKDLIIAEVEHQINEMKRTQEIKDLIMRQNGHRIRIPHIYDDNYFQYLPVP